MDSYQFDVRLTKSISTSIAILPESYIRSLNLEKYRFILFILKGVLEQKTVANVLPIEA